MHRENKERKDARETTAKRAGLTPPLLAGAALRAFFASNAKNGLKSEKSALHTK
jgi:hypothetical protein